MKFSKGKRFYRCGSDSGVSSDGTGSLQNVETSPPHSMGISFPRSIAEEISTKSTEMRNRNIQSTSEINKSQSSEMNTRKRHSSDNTTTDLFKIPRKRLKSDESLDENVNSTTELDPKTSKKEKNRFSLENFLLNPKDKKVKRRPRALSSDSESDSTKVHEIVVESDLELFNNILKLNEIDTESKELKRKVSKSTKTVKKSSKHLKRNKSKCKSNLRQEHRNSFLPIKKRKQTCLKSEQTIKESNLPFKKRKSPTEFVLTNVETAQKVTETRKKSKGKQKKLTTVESQSNVDKIDKTNKSKKRNSISETETQKPDKEIIEVEEKQEKCLENVESVEKIIKKVRKRKNSIEDLLSNVELNHEKITESEEIVTEKKITSNLPEAIVVLNRNEIENWRLRSPTRNCRIVVERLSVTPEKPKPKKCLILNRDWDRRKPDSLAKRNFSFNFTENIKEITSRFEQLKDAQLAEGLKFHEDEGKRRSLHRSLSELPTQTQSCLELNKSAKNVPKTSTITSQSTTELFDCEYNKELVDKSQRNNKRLSINRKLSDKVIATNSELPIQTQSSLELNKSLQNTKEISDYDYSADIIENSQKNNNLSLKSSNVQNDKKGNKRPSLNRKLSEKDIPKNSEQPSDKTENCSELNKSVNKVLKTSTIASQNSTEKLSKNTEKRQSLNRRVNDKEIPKNSEQLSDKTENCSELNKSVNKVPKTSTISSQNSTEKLSKNTEKRQSLNRRGSDKEIPKNSEQLSDKTENCSELNKSVNKVPKTSTISSQNSTEKLSKNTEKRQSLNRRGSDKEISKNSEQPSDKTENCSELHKSVNKVPKTSTISSEKLSKNTEKRSSINRKLSNKEISKNLEQSSVQNQSCSELNKSVNTVPKTSTISSQNITEKPLGNAKINKRSSLNGKLSEKEVFKNSEEPSVQTQSCSNKVSKTSTISSQNSTRLQIKTPDRINEESKDTKKTNQEVKEMNRDYKIVESSSLSMYGVFDKDYVTDYIQENSIETTQSFMYTDAEFLSQIYDTIPKYHDSNYNDDDHIDIEEEKFNWSPEEIENSGLTIAELLDKEIYSMEQKTKHSVEEKDRKDDKKKEKSHHSHKKVTSSHKPKTREHEKSTEHETHKPKRHSHEHKNKPHENENKSQKHTEVAEKSKRINELCQDNQVSVTQNENEATKTTETKQNADKKRSSTSLEDKTHKDVESNKETDGKKLKTDHLQEPKNDKESNIIEECAQDTVDNKKTSREVHTVTSTNKFPELKITINNPKPLPESPKPSTPEQPKTPDVTFPKPKVFKLLEKSEVKRPPSRPKKILLNRPTLVSSAQSSPCTFKVPETPVQLTTRSLVNQSVNLTENVLKKFQSPKRPEKEFDTISIYAPTLAGIESLPDTNTKDNSSDSDSDDDYSVSSFIPPMDPVKESNMVEWLNNTVTVCKTTIPESPEIKDIKTSYIFENVCYDFQKSGENCRKHGCLKHELPDKWQEQILKLSVDQVMTVYQYSKNLEYLYKSIFSVITSRLGELRDFNNLISMVKDVLEIEMNSDRAPFISDIINALCKTGVTFHSMVEFVYKNANVNSKLLDLLCDILLNLTVEKNDAYENWYVIKTLISSKNYDIDEGIIRSIIVECLTGDPNTKELYYKIYHDLLKKIPDTKFGVISESLLNNFYVRLQNHNYLTEKSELYARCQKLCITLGNKSDHCSPTTPESTSSTPKNKSILKCSPYIPTPSTSSGIQPLIPQSFIPYKNQPNINPVQPGVSGFQAVKPTQNFVQPRTKQQYFPQPNFSQPPPNFLPNYNSGGNQFRPNNYNRRNNKPKPNYHQDWYRSQQRQEQKPSFSALDVKHAVYRADIPVILSLIIKYKDNENTDLFNKTCFEALMETSHDFTTFFAKLFETTRIPVATSLDDKTLMYVVKTLAMNSVLYLFHQNNWEHAFYIYALMKKYINDDIFNVKLYLQEQYSYFKRKLIIAHLLIKKSNYDIAWDMIRECTFQIAGAWNDDKNDLIYRKIIMEELLYSLRNRPTFNSRKKPWDLGVEILSFAFTNKIDIDIFKHTNEIFLYALNSNCDINFFINFVHCSLPNWYSYISRNNFRAIIVYAVQNKVFKFAKQIFLTALISDVYPPIFGDDRSITIKTDYLLEEIHVIFDVFLSRMIPFYPINHNVVIKIENMVPPTEEIPKILRPSQASNLDVRTLQTRIANVLNNFVKPPVHIIARHNALSIDIKTLNNHLMERIKSSIV